MAALIDADMTVARFNFAHGDHAAHQEVLDRFRKVTGDKGAACASLMDTNGPDIHTAMLRGSQLMMEAAHSIIIEAVGDRDDKFEGFKTDTETRIGLSYVKLCAPA
jgi:pyruvate kinase